MLKGFLTQFNPATRKLRTQLALYFIPLSVLPAVFISVYATRVFEESTKDGLVRRAQSERDAIVGEIDTLESELLSEAKRIGKTIPNLGLSNDELVRALKAVPNRIQARLYSSQGQFLAKSDDEDRQIPYISKEGLSNLMDRGETIERFFGNGQTGITSVVRVWVGEGRKGILELESKFGLTELQELKNRRQVEVVFLTRSYKFSGWSVALPEAQAALSWADTFKPNVFGKQDASFVTLGDSRYAGFIYDLPSPGRKTRDWGFLAVLVPMAGTDAILLSLKINLIFITAIIIWVFAIGIFIFSRRVGRPVEALVNAMKRMKTGRVAEIPPIDSTYEFEYLVRAFNEMSRDVTSTKRALEGKLVELSRANQEIKNAQTTLIQSAKMISLGEIVAGVAHELNNPIGFIYSNMHHLNEYLDKFRKLVMEYRRVRKELPQKVQNELEKTEKALEIDYILKDMEELIRSVVDGANRTRDIVLGLRTFSRMDDSSFKYDDIHAGIRSTVKLLSTTMKNRITVHEDFGKIPEVECSLTQLNQVFMNLISNAAQAIEGRGDIWIRTQDHGNQVSIEVEDNGSGMSPAVMEKVFDPFFTTKKVGQGTGLGLSIAYGLIQKHHGTIDVKSQVGKGTIFTIRLPIQQPRKQTA